MIHTNRVVTVGDQESIIDKPIVLYRGDREVEVEFELIGNEFMFSTDGNVIKSVNASHGQLVLNTPSGDNMFSALAECHDGKVVFVITKEMIDEFIEIGFYSFQIRLYDGEQMKSRVTIPPVFSGIDIRNPIAAEDETNVVGQAVVDYARIYRDQSNEELPTFDWAGNYIKTDWVHHDVITENKMNKIEDGLWTINNKISESDNVFLKKAEDMEKQRQNDVNKLNSKDTQLTNDIQNVNRTLTNEINKVKVDIEVANEELRNDLIPKLDEIKRKSLSVNIEEFGAKGDNITDNKEYILNAIEFLDENGGGTLKIPRGVFQTSPFNLKDNITIEGVGKDSVLKVKQNNGSFYHFVSIADCQNVAIRNLTLDVNRIGNGGKIITTGVAGVKAQILIYIFNTKNAIIENCNLIACGIWAITMESRNDTPENRNIIIRDNYITWSEGNSDPQENLTNADNILYDNTMIFAEATNYLISNNTFVCLDGRGQTAIETHTGYGIAENNYIENFNNGVLVVANHWNVDNNHSYLYDRDTSIIIKNNIIKKANNGIQLWPMSNRELRDVIIDGNMIEINPAKKYGVACPGISNGWGSNSTVPHRNISIINNTIKYLDDNTLYTDSDHNTNFSGMLFGLYNPIYNLTINNNTIINSPSTGITVLSYGDKEVNGVSINNNTIINAGNNPNISTLDYNPKCAIRIGATVKNVSVGENTIIDTSDKMKLTKLYYFTGNSSIVYRPPIVLSSDPAFPKDGIKNNFTTSIRFDSQVGTMTTNINEAWYVRNGDKFRIYMDLVTVNKNTTQGYAAHIQTPFNFVKQEYKPLVFYENISAGSSMLLVCRTNNNTNSFHLLTARNDTTLGSLTNGAFKENSRIVVDFEVDIPFITMELSTFLKF